MKIIMILSTLVFALPAFAEVRKLDLEQSLRVCEKSGSEMSCHDDIRSFRYDVDLDTQANWSVDTLFTSADFQYLSTLSLRKDAEDGRVDGSVEIRSDLNSEIPTRAYTSTQFKSLNDMRIIYLRGQTVHTAGNKYVTPIVSYILRRPDELGGTQK